MDVTVRKIFDLLLNDEEYTVDDLAKIVKDNWSNETIIELIYMLMEGNKEACKDVSGWDLKAIGETKRNN